MSLLNLLFYSRFLNEIANLIFNSSGVFALILAIISVLWCTWSASTMFTTVLSMQNQKVLVAYPIGLLYSLFALLAVF